MIVQAQRSIKDELTNTTSATCNFDFIIVGDPIENGEVRCDEVEKWVKIAVHIERVLLERVVGNDV